MAAVTVGTELVLEAESIFGLTGLESWSGRPDSNRGPLAPKF